MSRNAQGSASGVSAKATLQQGVVVLKPGQGQPYKDAVTARRWPDGIDLVLRVEPEEEAWRYPDIKHYYGSFVRPFAQQNEGWTEAEAHAYFKAQDFFPEGKASLTELNREELQTFKSELVRFIAESHPDVELPLPNY